MNVTLKPGQERLFDEAIRAGLIGNVDEVVEVGVETIRHRPESRKAQAQQHEIDAAAEGLRKFGEKYRLSPDGLTIKELVDEGRR